MQLAYVVHIEHTFTPYLTSYGLYKIENPRLYLIQKNIFKLHITARFGAAHNPRILFILVYIRCTGYYD